MSENIIAAVVSYLGQAMAQDLTSVWAYYAQTTTPGTSYAVVQHGPEIYDDSQAGGVDAADGTGAGELVQADGILLVVFVTPTAQLAEALAHRCVLLCRDSQTTLACKTGAVEYFRPTRADSEPMMDTGPAIPGVFKRTVAIRYKLEFYAPGGISPVGAV